MYADSRQGILAQTTTLTSVMGKFKAGKCLSFYLFIKFTKDDSYRKFRYNSRAEECVEALQAHQVKMFFLINKCIWKSVKYLVNIDEKCVRRMTEIYIKVYSLYVHVLIST